MFELHIAETNVSEGSIRVGWCVSKEVLQTLVSQDYDNPMVVIITAPAGSNDYKKHKELRVAVPLKDLMAYVTFKYPGKNNVYAYIISDKTVKLDNVCAFKGSYGKTILSENGDTYFKFMQMYSPEIAYADPVSVDVPVECFAAEPASWDRAWVNYYFANESANECEWRKRKIYSYSIKPFQLCIDLVIRLIFTFVAFLWGSRNFSLKHIFSPLKSSIADSALQLEGGSIFIGGNKSNVINLTKWMLMPLFIAFCLFIIAMGHVILLIFIIEFIALMFFIGIGYWYALNFANTKYNPRIKDGSPWYMQPEEQNYIVCSSDKKKPYTFAELPKGHKTLKLRYLDLKSKVCKPFMG